MTTHRQSIFAVAVLAAALLGAAGAAMAHSGHDHGGPPPPAPVATAGPVAAASGEVFEVVLKPDARGGSLLFLADLDSNEPVAQAVVEVDVGAKPLRGEVTDSPGIYHLGWEFPVQPTDLTITISAGGHDDLLLLSGVAAPPAAAAKLAPGPSVPDQLRGWLGGGVATLAAVFGLGLIARRRGATGAVVLLLGLSVAGSAAFAHGGEDHGTPAPAAAEARPGQAVTMAKESQFLLGIRTAKATAQQVADSVRLVGRVVPDPAGYARLQPAQPGRVLATDEFPFPVPGQVVKRGEVLLVLQPNLTALERSDQRAALYKVETAIAQTDRQLHRWLAMGPAARQKDIDDARLDLARLHKEREQIENTALGRDLLKAPIDGVVTDVHVVPGQVVGSDTTAIEVVNPERLRVEAVLYDLTLAERIQAGQAATRLLPGQVFDLALIGTGARIDPQDQGLHLIFSVEDGARRLKLGMPVDVYARTGASTLRVAVPRAALAEAGGRPVVFVKIAPETFEPRPVRPGRSLGEWTEIELGLKAGERVVVQGAAQLAAAR